MPTMKMPTPRKRPTSEFYWIRKKVPVGLRALVGKTEVWASLKTKDERKANIRIGAVNAEIEAEWARLRAGGLPEPGADREIEPAPFKLTHQDLHALRGAAHVEIRDAWIKEPPTGFRKLRLSSRDEESLQEDAAEWLEKGGYEVSMENIERLKPLLLRARNEATKDVERARAGDYQPSRDLEGLPRRTTPGLDFVRAFEEFAVKGGLKGGKFGPTAKRWRPKIKAFCDFMGHRDLKRMTTGDGYNWVDRLIEDKYAHKSIKDVWVAALSATAGFMVERRKLDQNPFLRLTVREDKSDAAAAEMRQQQPPRKGFTPEEAKLILNATLATPSHLLSVEMRAARRWLPWLCAYSGARVNELTSLHPDDISAVTNRIWCMTIKPSLEKTAQWRVVPDPFARDRAGLPGLCRGTPKTEQAALLRSGPQPRRQARQSAVQEGSRTDRRMGAWPRHSGRREAEPRLAPSVQERGAARGDGSRSRRLHHGSPSEGLERGQRLRRPVD